MPMQKFQSRCNDKVLQRLLQRRNITYLASICLCNKRNYFPFKLVITRKCARRNTKGLKEHTEILQGATLSLFGYIINSTWWMEIHVQTASILKKDQ